MTSGIQTQELPMAPAVERTVSWSSGSVIPASGGRQAEQSRWGTGPAKINQLPKGKESSSLALNVSPSHVLSATLSLL